MIRYTYQLNSIDPVHLSITIQLCSYETIQISNAKFSYVYYPWTKHSYKGCTFVQTIETLLHIYARIIEQLQISLFTFLIFCSIQSIVRSSIES